MNHCCIIGGAGFIGSRVVELLVSAGWRVTVVGRSAAPRKPLSHGVVYLAGDYGDKAFLVGALVGASHVIDLAYATVPQTSFDDPVRDILGNLPPSVRLFEAAVEAGVRKIAVISSGGTVYGHARYLPIGEDHPTNPISPYGITKLAIEKYGLMYHAVRALPVVIIRPGNAYGPGQAPYAGQGFVATAMASVLQGKSITLYGEHGTIRDYVHVADVARGIVAALEKGVPGTCYNIGSGIGRSNRDIIDAIVPLAKPMALEVKVQSLPERRFDVPANVLDSSRLLRDTGWRAEIPLAQGLEETWTWLVGETGRQGRQR
jgi:UDP-glucose 4-epimerase